MIQKTGISRERTAGILLHIASLPGRYGIGTMGEEARHFVDFLSAAGVRYWQVLPLVQTGYGDSPYQSEYGASGNPYFIDLETLVADGLLKKSELSACRHAGGRIDYGFLYERKYAVLRKAFSRFDCANESFAAFEREGEFCDYAQYMAIKKARGSASFDRWEKPLRLRDPQALQNFFADPANLREYRFWLFLQFEFRRQWRALKAYANERGVQIIGDIPLYVAYDSADVWANPSLFKLNKNLTRRKVAGVPPDYFSATGQLWGNPVYDWKKHEGQGFSWWIERIRRAFKLYDVVRIDHFRGFDRYFEIDASAETAVQGKWKRGPGIALFEAAKNALGDLHFIAEDLGTLDAGVLRLIRRTGYPGMKVLQFAFDGNPENDYLPANIPENSVCYTGTHDNDTMVGYLRSLPAWECGATLARIRAELKNAGIRMRVSGAASGAEAVCMLAWSSRAALAVLPVQDLLLLGSEARMNTPATSEGNWQFRLTRIPSAQIAQQLRAVLERFGRLCSDR